MAKESNVRESETLKGVRVLRAPFRNFAGRPTKFNEAGGVRAFNVVLDEREAEELAAKGWHVKELAPLDEGGESLKLLEVKVSYKGRPPTIRTITQNNSNKISEENVETLDNADISHADIIVNPYNWGGPACSAYLQTGHFHIELDELEAAFDTSGEDPVVCDDDGVCYINGVRIN